MQQEKPKPVSVVEQCLSTDGMFELDNLKLAPHRGENPNGTTREHDDDEEGVLEEDSDSDNDDDGISSSYHSTATSSAMHHHQQQQHHHGGGTPNNMTYFLGHAFNSTTDRLAMQSFQKSLYWFTYRSDLVVPLRPYNNSSALTAMKHPQLIGEHLAMTGSGAAAGMRSDAGWGCMLRSAQMMLAQAVRRHYNPVGGGGGFNNINSRSGGDASKKYGSKATTSCKDGESDPWEAQRIAHWFADFPNHVDDNDDNELHRYNSNNPNHDETTMKNTKSSRPDDPNSECYGTGGIQYHWYSLHQMVAAGIGLGILPGEWYGPTTACHVLRELNEIHCERRERLAKRLFTRKTDGSDDGVTPDMATSEDECNASHQTSSASAQGDKSLIPPSCDMFRVHISTEGCIYVDAIMKLMTRSKSGSSDDGDGTEGSNNHVSEIKGRDYPLSLHVDEIDDPLRQPTATSRNQHGTTNDGTIESTTDIVEWDTSLLLLLPLRLGIHNISTSDYGSTLAKLIAFPHSVGMLGGTPRHALWFYGADAIHPPTVAPSSTSSSSAKTMGEKFSSDQDVIGGWYGLDPHTVQLAPRGTRVLVDQTSSSSSSSSSNNTSNIDDANKATYKWQVQITDTYLRSLHISPTSSHPNNQRSIPLSKLDPSCALGFYIRDHADFVHFQQLIKSLSEEHCRPNKLPESISVLEKTPNYEMDVSSAIKDMIGRENGVVKDAAAAAAVDDLDGFSIQSEQEDGIGKEYVDDEEEDDDDDFVLV